MTEVWRIFVSSTWLDLQSEREEVQDTINRMQDGKFVGMEYFGSRPEDTEQASVVEVDDADIYLGIIGGRYGSGITEKEYRRARGRDLPCFIYFKDDEAVLPEGRDDNSVKVLQLAAFKQDLRQAHTVSHFRTKEQLANQVQNDLYREFMRRRKEEFERTADGSVTAKYDEARTLRLLVGAKEGSLVYNVGPQRPRPRQTPVQLGPKRLRGLLDRTAECTTALKELRGFVPVEFYGPEGIGKTALLRHLAYQPTDGHFVDGVIYHEVRQQPADDLLQFIFDAFYESDPSYKPREGELRTLLGNKRGLVLLDEVELPRAEIERVINVVPECAFLLASSERHLVGEGRALNLRGLPESDAAQLLEDKLERALTLEEHAAAQQICVMLGGHPLHIAQAAAIALERTVPLGEIAAWMQEAQAQGELPAALLNRHLADVGSDDEKRVLAALSALNGAPVRAESLAAIVSADNVEATLEKLVRLELVEGHDACYRLTKPLEVVLDQKFDLTEWRVRALNHFIVWAEQRDHKQLGTASSAVLTILNWATQSERWQEAKRLGKAIEGKLILSGRWETWAEVLQQIHLAADATGDKETVAWVLHQQGTRELSLGNSEMARRLLTEALELRIELGNHIAASATRHNLDWVMWSPPPPPPTPSQTQSEPPSRFPPPWLLPATKAVLLGGLVIVAAGLLIKLFVWICCPPSPPPPPFGVRFNPAQLNFATQKLNVPSAPQLTTVTNPGPSALTIGPIRFRGNAAHEFTIKENECAGLHLTSGKQCRLRIAFTPRAEQERSAELIVSSNTEKELGRMNVSGKGEAGTPTRSETRVRLNPTEYDFGPREVGTSHKVKIELHNSDAPLKLTRPTFEGNHKEDFAVTSNACSGHPIAADKSCTILVSFTPGGEGIRNASMQVNGNIAGGPKTIPFSGTGLVPRPSNPLITPAQLNFGPVRIGQVVLNQVTVTNNSNPLLKITSLDIVGVSDFVVSPLNCANVALAQGASCRVPVRFQPSQLGDRSAQLRLKDNTRAGEQAINLSGHGIEQHVPRASLLPLEGASCRDGDIKVTIRNRGDAVAGASEVTVTITKKVTQPIERSFRFNIPPIQAGRSVVRQFTVRPCVGNCSAKIKVDSQNQITERDEGNNEIEIVPCNP